MMNKIFYIIFIYLQLASLAFSEESEPCAFNNEKKMYEGSKIEQASCLLRKVSRFGKISSEEYLPETIKSKLIKGDLDYTLNEIKMYILDKSINDIDNLGGSIEESLHEKTRYFIIHDTSTPNFGASNFPENINTTERKWNDLDRYRDKAHVFINRLGNSLTKNDLSKNYRTTKFENKRLDRKNIAVGIELVQPRRAYPPGSDRNNDALSPDPGFTKKQMERLALIYYAASIRANEFLIPAFHAVIDIGMDSPHDDPQNFSLDEWDKSLRKVFNEIKISGGNFNHPLFYICGNSESDPIYCEQTTNSDLENTLFYACGSLESDPIYCEL